MEFLDVVKERYSVRKFNDEVVSSELLKKILEVGLLAPTAKNIQPVKIYVLQSKEALEKLDSLTHCRYGASTVLLFTYNNDEDWKNPLEDGIHSGIEDVSIVATHIMLSAKNEGVDTCWCNYFANSKLEELLNIPKNEKSVLIMPIGYADETSKPAPGHSESKNFDDIFKYI